MTRFLVAADTVHEAAAACDYLVDRLGSDDVVTVLTVVAPGGDPRDGEDAANVAAVRLEVLATVESVVREGEPARTVLDLAVEHDEVVLPAVRGPDGHPDETAIGVLSGASIPVVVLPPA